MRKGMSSPQSTVNSDLLQKIFRRSSDRLRTLAAEGEEELLQIIHRKAEAAQDAGKDKLEVTFTHTIKVNFSKGTQVDTLGGTMKVALQLEGKLDDPDQPELGFDDEPED